MTTAFDTHDRLVLIDRHHRYSHCLDGRDLEGLLDLFFDDAVAVFDRHGKVDTFTGRAEIANLYRPGIEAPDPVRHLMTNLVFDEQTDTTASTNSYVMVTRKTEGRFTLANTVTYQGRWRKDDGVWRIVRWTITAD